MKEIKERANPILYKFKTVPPLPLIIRPSIPVLCDTKSTRPNLVPRVLVTLVQR